MPGFRQDLKQESQRRAREVETLEQQLSKAAAATWPDETNNFQLQTGHTLIENGMRTHRCGTFITMWRWDSTRSGCTWKDLAILRLAVEHSRVTEKHQQPKIRTGTSCKIKEHHLTSRKQPGVGVLRSYLHVSTLRIRTRSAIATQRRSRNFNLGSPKRPRRLGSTWPTAA